MGANGGDDPSDETEQPYDQPASDVSLSLDATLELLANYERRCILDYLVESSDETAMMDELVEYLVQRKADRTGERPGHDHVLATLHHVHVPKLADVGVVEYDERSREIRYWRNERLEKWHERIRHEERD